MAFRACILADSISPAGVRLTTFEATFPRCILAEVNTHRMLSRNAASSRAIPVEKMIERIIADPFIPEFRANQKGMQAGDPIEERHASEAYHRWLETRDDSVNQARELHKLNIHKQYINRLLEPWMWCTMIISATDWENFFALRCHPDAEPSFQRIATMMRELYRAGEPTWRGAGTWHLPLIDEEDEDACAKGTTIIECFDRLKRISVGRCARVSYLTHDGKRDHQADIDLCDRLSTSGHWSPFEHVAQPIAPGTAYSGNFRGWRQCRKDFAGENVTEARDGC